ncbi:MAG: hypothetical protein ACC742_01045 [Thermoanaerobaculales bacterium]
MTWSPTVSAGGRIALSRFYWIVHLLDAERLVFNAGEMTGDIYTAKLDEK